MPDVTSAWLASPADTAAAGGGNEEIISVKQAYQERLAREHELDPTEVSPQPLHGRHRLGSARAYLQASAPTTKPDGVALDSNDSGRLWIDSDDGLLKYRTASAWADLKVNDSVLVGGLATATAATASTMAARDASGNLYAAEFVASSGKGLASATGGYLRSDAGTGLLWGLNRAPTTRTLEIEGSVYAKTSLLVGSLSLIGSEIGRFVALAGDAQVRIGSYSATSAHTPALTFAKSHQNTEGYTATVTGENLGLIQALGNNGTAFAYGAYVGFVQNGAAGATYTPADIVFGASSGSANATEVARFSGVNKSFLVGLSTSTSSLYRAEFATGGTNNGFALHCYSATASTYNRLVMFRSHSDTVGAKVSTIDTEVLGALFVYGVDGQTSPAFGLGASMIFTQSGAAGGSGSTPGYIPTTLQISTSPGGTTTPVVRITVNPDGKTGFARVASTYQVEVAGGIYAVGGDHVVDTGRGLYLDSTHHARLSSAGLTVTGGDVIVATGQGLYLDSTHHARISSSGLTLTGGDYIVATGQGLYFDATYYARFVTGVGLGIGRVAAAHMLEVEGSIKATNGFVHGGSVTWIATDTQNTVYDAIRVLIPTAATTLAARGEITVSSVTHPIIAMVISSSEIVIGYSSGAGAVSLRTITNGSATAMGDIGCIAF